MDYPSKFHMFDRVSQIQDQSENCNWGDVFQSELDCFKIEDPLLDSEILPDVEGAFALGNVNTGSQSDPQSESNNSNVLIITNDDVMEEQNNVSSKIDKSVSVETNTSLAKDLEPLEQISIIDLSQEGIATNSDNTFDNVKSGTKPRIKFTNQMLNRTTKINKQKNSIRPHACEKFNQSFQHRHRLKRHRKNVHQLDSSYQCIPCKTYFKKKQDLRTHSKKEHGTERLFLCSLCDEIFEFQKHLRCHLQEFHCVKKSRCDKWSAWQADSAAPPPDMKEVLLM